MNYFVSPPPPISDLRMLFITIFLGLLSLFSCPLMHQMSKCIIYSIKYKSLTYNNPLAKTDKHKHTESGMPKIKEWPPINIKERRKSERMSLNK